MRTIFDYLSANWSFIVFPLAVFILSLIVFFGLRKLTLDRLARWLKKNRWLEDSRLLSSLKRTSALFCLILSIHLGLLASRVPDAWKQPIGSGLWTLFVIALTLTSLSLSSSLIFLSSRKLNLPPRAVLVTRNLLGTAILVVALLIVLDLWGVPTTPLLLLIAILLMAAIFAFRDTLPNVFASFQIAVNREIKVGDYIKLEEQEEGYVTNIGWSHTYLQTVDGSKIIVPNLRVVRQKVINYGRPLKKAVEPFFFKTRPQMAEMTGLKASNLQELVKILKDSPEAVIYYHTHHFLGEKYRPVAHPSSDFALWVRDALGNPALAERLARINVCEFSDLRVFKDKIVNTIEEYLVEAPNWPAAKSGREFNFMKTANVVIPTDYIAHDLREFVEGLRKISPSSLYYHVFESRSRFGNGANDFSLWLEKSLGEPELGREIATIDPCAYSLEELRSLLVQRIEKSIK